MHLANDLFRSDPAGMPDMKLTLLFFRLVIILSTLYLSEYTSAFPLWDLHILCLLFHKEGYVHTWEHQRMMHIQMVLVMVTVPDFNRNLSGKWYGYGQIAS
jgi:hypothetical protein